MIFSLQFLLLFAGYGAVSNLSGNYMERYTDADDFHLGLYFMIPHFLHITRPFIGALADRNRSHKKVYAYCALITTISYVPYILLPFFLKSRIISRILTKEWRFWMLAIFHISGSIGLNACRTFADALAKNHAVLTDIDYVSMRMYAPVGLGLCSYFSGFLNVEWIMPDYVPAMIAFSLCMLMLASLIHCWPDEYFVMVCSKDEDVILPTTREIMTNALKKVIQPFKKHSSYKKQLKTMTEYRMNIGNLESASVKSISISHKAGLELRSERQTNQLEKRPLSLYQQIRILGLVMRRDFRVSLAFVLLFFAGWVCRSAQNFVFVQVEEICQTRKTCHPGTLSGNMLAGTSVLEFITYFTLSKCKGFNINRIILVQIVMLSIAVHYYFYGFFVENLSTQWFLIESLFGFEFAILITSTLSWGYTFASEVGPLIPELQERGVINEKDELDLVKVSIVATMLSCMALLFEGFGSTTGSAVYSFIIYRYSYSSAWITNGTLALSIFMIIFTSLGLKRLFRIKPKIEKLKAESAQTKIGH